MAASVGYAVLPIVPSLKNFKKTLDRSVTPILKSAGSTAQRELGKGFKSAYGELERASKKATAEAKKLEKSLETASNRRSAALTKQQNATAALERQERKYQETMSKHMGKVEAQEKYLQSLREQGKTTTKAYYNAEQKLVQLRQSVPSRTAEQEAKLSAAREKLKTSTIALNKRDKDLVTARLNASKASKAEKDALAALEGQQGKNARAQDAMRAAMQKVGIMARTTGGALQKMSNTIGAMSSKMGAFAASVGGKALRSMGSLATSALTAGANITKSLGSAALNAVGALGNKLMGLAQQAGKAGAAIGAGLAAVSAKKGFDRLVAIEQSEVKLKTFGVNVDKAMTQANKAVKGTAFGLGDAATATATLSAAGIKLGKNMEQSLGLIADTAAVTGSSFGEISSIYSKIAAAGKLDGSTLDQLQDRGVSVLGALSKASGKTQAEIRKDISDGKVSYQQFADAMEKAVGGAAQRSGDTVKGSFANMGAALGRLGADMQKSTFAVLPKVFQNITKAIDNVAPSLVKFTEAGRKDFADFLVKSSEKLVKASEGFGKTLLKIKNSKEFRSIVVTLNDMGDSAEKVAPLIGAIAGTTVMTAITILTQALHGISDTFKVLVSGAGLSSKEIADKFAGAGKSLTDTTGTFFKALPGVVQTVVDSPVWGTLKTVIGSVFDFVKTMAPSAIEVLKASFGAVGTVLSAVFTNISAAFSGENGGTGGAEAFAAVLRDQVVPWIQNAGDKVAELVNTYLPPLLDTIKTKIPEAMNVIANDENFVKARENALEILNNIVLLAPELAKIAGSGSLVGLQLMNELLQAAAPMIRDVIVPMVQKLAEYLSENEGAAQGLGFALAGIFVGGKITTGISGMIGTVQTLKSGFDFFKSLGGNAKEASGALGGVSSVVEALKGKVGKLGGAISAAFSFLAANPIVLIIAGIVAAGTALYLFFTKTETGKKMWAKMVEGMKYAWDKWGKPAIHGLGNAMKWVWEKVIKPVSGFIGEAFKKTFNVIKWTWDNVLKPVFGFLGDAVKWVWNKIIKPIFPFIKKMIVGAFDAIAWTWKNVLKPAFDVMGQIIKWLWEKFVKPNLPKIKKAFEELPGVVAHVADVWGKRFNRIKDMLTGFRDKIKSVVDAVKKIWQGLVDVLTAPVKLAGGAIDKIKGFFGGGKKGKGDGYASGGVLPGYTPGRDVHTYIDPTTGHRLHLSGGEAIMRPEWVRAMGGASAIDKINRQYSGKSSGSRGSRFATGGVYKAPSGDKMNVNINNPTLKTNSVKVNAQQARIDAIKKAREGADTAAADRRTLADLRADLYTTLRDDPVSQARGALMKEQAAAAEAASKLATARRFNDPRKDIQRLTLEKQVADARLVSSNKQLQAAIRQEQADRIAEAKQKAEAATSAKKTLAEAQADLYALQNTGEIGAAVADVQRATAEAVAAAETLQQARQFNETPETIQRLSVEKQIADVKITAANEALRKAQEQAEIERKAKEREADTQRIDNLKTARDLESEIYGLLHTKQSGSAQAELMKANADSVKALAMLKQAQRYGDDSATVDRLRLEYRVASLKERAAKAQLAAAKAEERAAEIAKIREWKDEDATNRDKWRSLQADIYAEKNRNSQLAAAYADMQRASSAATLAEKKLQNARDANALWTEINTLKLEKQLTAAKAVTAQEEYLKAKREQHEKTLEENQKRLEELATKQTRWNKILAGFGAGLGKIGEGFQAFSDMTKALGDSLKTAKDNLVKGYRDLINAMHESEKSLFEIQKAERETFKVRLEGQAKIKDAEAKLTTARTKQFKLMTTAASGLVGAEKLATKFYTTVEKLGGTFMVNSQEMLKSQAELLLTRAQVAFDVAKAEFEEKKSRLEYKKSVQEQARATKLLNIQLSEYIAKSKLLNGIDSRGTDALSQYYGAVGDALQAQAAKLAADEKLKFGTITRDEAKIQEALAEQSAAASKLYNAQFKQQLYQKDAMAALNKLPADMKQGLLNAAAQDSAATARAVQQALARKDYAGAAEAAKQAGRILGGYMESVAGVRRSLDEFVTWNADYERDAINFNYDQVIADLAEKINILDLSASKALEGYQAQIDAAEALKNAAETEDKATRDAWLEAAKAANDYAVKAGEKSKDYNKGKEQSVVVNFEPDGYYSGKVLAEQLAQATERIESVEVQLSGKKVTAAEYLDAH